MEENYYYQFYNSEDDLCMKFYQLYESYVQLGKADRYSLWHVNNGEHGGGGERARITRIVHGKKAKAMGQLKGVFDYTAVQPDGVHLYLEAKYKKNGLTPSQKLFKKAMEEKGIKCYIFRDVSTAIDILINHGVIKE